ncbi:hypothetical protein C1645_834065 [Glomus cerebriforme]|uniref:Uncharacterized protein n=1 Tax=Glomus cerebriforme TaxID=658196 RepID=A0A397SAC6_9GLOM|nr:hypothetical protein C1645_834065 [Glomus cerebriforme]
MFTNFGTGLFAMYKFLTEGKICAEIELFYLLPNQRRWKHDSLKYYYANADKAQEEIQRLMSKGQWETNENKLLIMKKDLSKELKINNIDKSKADLQQLLEKRLEKTVTNLLTASIR